MVSARSGRRPDPGLTGKTNRLLVNVVLTMRFFEALRIYGKEKGPPERAWITPFPGYQEW
jgi:hypothetical protein